MEILIMEKLCGEEMCGYLPVYSDNCTMSNLGSFFHLAPVDRILTWTGSPKDGGISVEYSNIDLENGVIKIYDENFSDSVDDIESYYKNAFTTTLKKFIKMLNRWKKIQLGKPAFVVVMREGDEIFFHEDYKEEIDIDIFKVKLTKEGCERILQPKFKDGFFYGGYHFKDHGESIEMKNKRVDKNNSLSCDITFKKDFTFNHAFFSDDWD